MGISTALSPPPKNIINVWSVVLRRLSAAGNDNLFTNLVQQPSQEDGNSLVRIRTVAGELATIGDVAVGAFGIRSDQSTLIFAGAQITQAFTQGRARVPVEEYWLGGTQGKVRTKNQLWRMDWGPTFIDTITDGGGPMWYGVGLGGGTTMAGGGAWATSAFLGWLWDPNGAGAGGVANWTLAGRAESGAYFHNVDSGLSVATTRHLEIHIGQEHGAAIARWIADGGVVLETSLPGTAFAPTFTNDQRNFGPAALGARLTPLTDGFRGWTALQGIARLDVVYDD